MKRTSLLGLVCTGALIFACDSADSAWQRAHGFKFTPATAQPSAAPKTPVQPEAEEPKTPVLTPTDLINKIIRANVKEDSDIDFMFTMYERFAEASPKSIARRVYDKVGKGKREANYKPKAVDIEECLPALEQLSRPDYHEDNEKAYISQMAQKFEEFELKSS